MRISTGLRFFFALAAGTSLTAGFVACSGSDDQDVISEDAGVDSTRPETSVPDTSAPDTSRPDTGPKDSGPQFDAGPRLVLDGGDAGIQCVSGGLAEEEPNDESAQANVLDPADASCAPPGCSRCGVLIATDLDAGGSDAGGGDAGGAAEVEFLSFDLHATAKSFYLQYEVYKGDINDLNLAVTVDGQGPFMINQASSPTLPFVRGKTYYVQVTSKSGKPLEWRVTLFEVQ